MPAALEGGNHSQIRFTAPRLAGDYRFVLSISNGNLAASDALLVSVGGLQP